MLAKLDTANLLSNIVTRTRRRDVEELRVVRQVYALKQNMSPAEEAFYEKVTFAVRRYADTKDIVQNFLLASPQRMMASCMYGALSIGEDMYLKSRTPRVSCAHKKKMTSPN